MSEAPASPTNRAARAVFLAACAGFMALTAWIFVRSIVLAPYSDLIDLLARYLDFRNHHDLAAYLLDQHNFHRLPVLMGLIGLDASAHAGGRILTTVGALSLAGAAAILAFSTARAAQGTRLQGAALAAMLALLPGNLLSAAIHLNTLYVHGLVFAVAALALAEPEEDGAQWLRRIAALACAIAACLSGGAGLAVWPVLVLGALRNREEPAWLVTLLVMGGAMFAFYFEDGGANGTSGLDPAGTVQYALSTLGLPWGRIAPAYGWLIGAFVLLAALAALLFKGRPGAPRAERLATRFILYSLAVAAMIALGRVGRADAGDVPLRYAAFLTPLHVGLLMLLLPYVARWRLAGPALAAVALLFVAQQAVMGLAAIRTTDVNRKLIGDFRQGQRYPAMVPTVHHDLDHAAAVYGRLDAAGVTRRPAPPTQIGEK